MIGAAAEAQLLEGIVVGGQTRDEGVVGQGINVGIVWAASHGTVTQLGTGII